ncbi:MAG: type II toxin-antitoxin system VapC family toxin [bacterium]|nr:type II toxin-antitoxin system VapC family toxin [bacterium]
MAGKRRQGNRPRSVVEITATLSRRCPTLLKRHPLRAADALQLASCLELGGQLDLPLLFVAYDNRLNEAAKKEGLELGS